MNRGQIRNRQQAQQLMLFAGLRWHRITPTNIDLAVEFEDRLFVFAEAKHGASELPGGQRLCLERICNAIHAPPADRFAILFQVEHRGSGDILLARCPVVRYYWFGRWWPAPPGLTLRHSIDKTLQALPPRRSS